MMRLKRMAVTLLRLPKNLLLPLRQTSFLNSRSFSLGEKTPQATFFAYGNRSATAAAPVAGEFVLLGQGRHVLDNSQYRDIVIAKLESDKVRLGPVTVSRAPATRSGI